MEITVENTSTLGRRLKIQVPKESMHSRYQQQMNELGKTANIKGFRVGQVNTRVLEQRFGKQLRQDVINKAIEESLSKAIADKSLRVAGQANIESLELQPLMQDPTFNHPLEYQATLEVYPDITLEGIEGISITRKMVTIEETDVAQALEKARQHLGSWASCDRPITSGDFVKIDYESTIEGKPYEGSQAKDISVEVGKEQFIEGFEAGLMGKCKGDTVVLDLRFPEKWRLETLAGKPVQFTITITDVRERKLAPVDQVLANLLKAKSDAEADILAKVREDLGKQCERKAQESLRDQAAEKVLTAKAFDLPDVMVKQEHQFLHQDLHRQHSGNEESAHGCQGDHEGLNEQARRRVALGLLLGEVIRQNNIQLDSQRVKERLQLIAENFPDNSYIERAYSQSEALMNSLKQAVLTEQALDWLVSKLSVQDESSTVKELMGW